MQLFAIPVESESSVERRTTAISLPAGRVMHDVYPTIIQSTMKIILFMGREDTDWCDREIHMAVWVWRMQNPEDCIIFVCLVMPFRTLACCFLPSSPPSWLTAKTHDEPTDGTRQHCQLC